MVMPDLSGTWTREAVLALPDDGNRYELVDGRLLATPSPRLVHQVAILERDRPPLSIDLTALVDRIWHG